MKEEQLTSDRSHDIYPIEWMYVDEKGDLQLKKNYKVFECDCAEKPHAADCYLRPCRHTKNRNACMECVEKRLKKE